MSEDDAPSLKIKLELNFSSQLTAGEPWPIQTWVAIVAAAAPELSAAAGVGAPETAQVRVTWCPGDGFKVKSSVARMDRRRHARVDELFARLSKVSASYSWPGVWLHIEKSLVVPGVLRLCVVVPGGQGGIDPDATGVGDVSSDVLARMYLDLAAVGDATFGEVIPMPADFRLTPLTALEACLIGDLAQYESGHDIPSWYQGNPDPISHAPQFLRGYGWITLLTGALCQRLGGPEVLASREGIERVHGLPNGAVAVQATERIQDYDERRAELLWAAVAPVLRPGKPRHDALNEVFSFRPGVEPVLRPLTDRVGRLIVMRDAETVR